MAIHDGGAWVSARRQSASSESQLVASYQALDDDSQVFVEALCLGDGAILHSALIALVNTVLPKSAWHNTSQKRIKEALASLPQFIASSNSSNVAPVVSPLLRSAIAVRMIASGRVAAWVAACRNANARISSYESVLDRPAMEQRLQVAGLYAGLDPDLQVFQRYFGPYSPMTSPLLLVMQAALHSEVVMALHPTTRALAVAEQLMLQLDAPDAEATEWLKVGRGMLGVSERADHVLIEAILRHETRRGELKVFAELASRSPINVLLKRAFDAAVSGEPAARVGESLEEALKLLRREFGPARWHLDLFVLLHMACLTVLDTPGMLKRRAQLMKLNPSDADGLAIHWWQQFISARASGQTMKEPILPARTPAHHCWWLAVLLTWSKVTFSDALRETLRVHLDQAQVAGWHLLAAQLSQVIGDTRPGLPTSELKLVDWCRPQGAWESALQAIGALARSSRTTSAGSGATNFSRIQVRVGHLPGIVGGVILRLVEQRPQAKGFSAGRPLTSSRQALDAMQRIEPGENADRRLLEAYAADIGAYGYFDDVKVGESRTAQALIGHPHVVESSNPGRAVAVVASDIGLHARRGDDGRIDLRLSRPIPIGSKGMLELKGTQLTVYRFDDTLQGLARIVGDGLRLPPEAVAPLLDLLPDLSQRVKLDTDLASFGVREAAADMQVYAQLDPIADGLRLRLVVRPLGPDSAAHALGVGAETVMATVDGTPHRAQRRLAAEREAGRQLCLLCPGLEGLDLSAPIEVRDPEAALALIEGLQAAGSVLVLEWPTGKQLRIGKARDDKSLTLTVKRQRDWFSADGGLALDDGSVVALSEILRQLPSATGRYLRLDGERIIALEGELRRRLELLHGFADDKGKLSVSAVAAPIFAEALDEQDEIDVKFRDQLKRINRAQQQVASIPADFQADLRDYQVDGFRFLMRLAGWGAGACLADDMGLGKTVQALAMLTARAAEGPALVLAPTSVVGNWRREALRFAPGLNVRVFGEGDREEALNDLVAGDLVLASYGLLTAQIERFEKIAFATLVLDEAQAIKNAATQRAQAVRRLQADFRVATTGTPLENHLGELWSLFRVLNPGLLGSEEQFRKRFVNAMERDPRAPEREHLRRLLAPFLLRRTKAEVLTELPPRTEILLTVEPSAAEAQLLAAVKRQSLERLNDKSLPPEQRRVQVLAEIMRLRRAACHPDLVAPELGISSAKLEHLVELVQELIDNRHRALVFSQFVDYLSLVRERFDREGIDYQYLDGSTSQKGRDAAVAAFQRGEGKVFLLSLKAGGVGINLTAADYVIHLDPWWNPAVEQQASDRAHRIGQTRPVTIYKLVLKGSIEEQVIALHASKRELIDQVIEGQNSAARMSVDELLAMLADS